MDKKGFFIAIEGTDGSGKGTQFKLLESSLKKAGFEVALFDFPQYDQPSSFFVKEYLNGAYGSVNQVNPYMASLFYSLDRYHAAAKIREYLRQGKIVLANRFIASNMGHQGQKFTTKSERQAYFDWVTNIEFSALQIPKPDLNIVLVVPADIAQAMVDKKQPRSYTEKKRDIHEADLEHLKRAVMVYEELCKLYPDDFTKIECTHKGKIQSIDKIHNALKEVVMSKITDNPKKLLNKANNIVSITPEGYDYLKNVVTDPKGDVYAFVSSFSPMTAAAAMARLSRRFDDLRVTILDEFTDKSDENEKLLKRVITAYGDDSVQQLIGEHLVVEGASNLLTKKLEWGRLGAYLEQSTRYIYYDQKDADGNYRYYTPDNFDKNTKVVYKTAMDKIFYKYSEMVHKTTDYVRQSSSVKKDERDVAWQGATRAQACDAIRHTLPIATRSTVGLYLSGQSVESLIMHLLSDDLLEARLTGKKILKEARKIIPAFLERADKPDRGGARIAYCANTKKKVKSLADKYLPQNNATQTTEAVTLVDYYPKNELDIVADMLYEHSNMSLEAIQSEVDGWPYKHKLEVFNSYIGERLNRRQKPGRAFEKLNYNWDIVCDYGVFRDLQRHRIVSDLEWQQLTPRYGYDIPELVEKAGVVEQFLDCFDLSLELFSYLQQKGYELESQYSTLMGHKMRWKVSYNAREAFHLHELRTVPQGHPGYRKLVNQMHEQLLSVHPVTGEAMKFVNQDEDPELNRLAAERYSQYKLKILDKKFKV